MKIYPAALKSWSHIGESFRLFHRFSKAGGLFNSPKLFSQIRFWKLLNNIMFSIAHFKY